MFNLPKRRRDPRRTSLDRVAHHWLVPRLEAIYGAGVHSTATRTGGRWQPCAVRRKKPQSFVRQVASSQGRGYYLQLDVGTSSTASTARLSGHSFALACSGPASRSHAARSPCIASALASPPACALPSIGQRTVSSPLAQTPRQRADRLRFPSAICRRSFSPNVLLNELSQFVEARKLRYKRTLHPRYVDDFVWFTRAVNNSRSGVQPSPGFSRTCGYT